MANIATVYYDDGSTSLLKYRLSKIVRYLKNMQKLEKYKGLKKAPIFPWLLKMALSDAETCAVDRKIIRIEISEKVI